MGLESATTRVVLLWKSLTSSAFPNGIVMFSSRDILEVFHPPRPLMDRIYVSGTQFDTSPVIEALSARQTSTYGLIAIDGEDATLGLIFAAESNSSSHVKPIKLAHVSANIASRTRRGGQSALRYSRLRDSAELAFLRKVADMAVGHFSDITGLVVGGKADLKRKLLLEMPSTLQSKIKSVVDIACGAGLEGLRQVSLQIGGIHEKKILHHQEQAVHRFLEVVGQTDAHAAPLVCYGEEQTLTAMRLGAVKHLIIASSVFRENSPKRVELENLAQTIGASISVIDEITSCDVQFCQGFQIGAFLRWHVDPALLEELLPECTCVEKESNEVQGDKSDDDTISTAASRSDDLLLQWLEGALNHALKDPSAAEALTMCADAILSDDSTTVEERLHNTVDMLCGEGVPEEVLSELIVHIRDSQEGVSQ